ncbi:MAG: toll/interleukin-1 receptor domain-containing protein [Anaerolineae bacterium]|nr:toll/interleukin-1 receptor domain-containing protein [Anaerolineae bacterium]
MAPLVFIGYSHQDDEKKNHLLSHLGILERNGLIELWTDDCIPPGANRRYEIRKAIARADIAVLLITADFLNSDTINEHIIEPLNRRHEQGLIIYPIIAKPCAWQTAQWLAGCQVRPDNGRPVWTNSHDKADDYLVKFTEEIRAIVMQLNRPDPVSLPFLIAAMTRKEAVELFKDDILLRHPDSSPAEVQRFAAFKAALLKQVAIEAIIESYTIQRTNWKPLIGGGKTIKKVVLDTIQTLTNNQPDQRLLKPDFSLSQSLFQPSSRRNVLKNMDRTVGVVLIDAVSMFHPHLKQGLSSGIATHKHVAILVLSPLDTRQLPINQLIEETISHQMQTAVARFEQFEPLCQTIGISDSRIFEYQLFNMLPQTAEMQAQLRLAANVKRLEYEQGQQMMMDKGPVDFWSIGEKP